MQATRPIALFTATFLLFGTGSAQADPPADAIKLTPADFKWAPSKRVPGLERAPISGDETKAEPYIYRVKFPANFKLQAHGHPDTRTYTIISGTWYIGWGKKFDESKLIALPAGSYYTEPANAPHFVATKGEVIVQITGKGPTGVNYIDPAHAPKKK